MSHQLHVASEPLSAKHNESYAYRTVKDRLPVILTSVVDHLARQKHYLGQMYGHEVLEDCKKVVGLLSKLRNELQTDKAFIPLTDSQPDSDIWNNYLATEKKKNPDMHPSWFKSPWLYTECYLYRRFREAFHQTNNLGNYDPFFIQKQNSFHSSRGAISVLMDFLKTFTDISTVDHKSLRNNFLKFLQIALWGNRCDLSLSAGKDNFQKDDPLEQVNTLKSNILVNHSQEVWETLQKSISKHPKSVSVHIVLDNAGFELICDLCFAEFLISSKLATEIIFYVKTIPWFVSDVTLNDFNWTLDQCFTSSHLSEVYLGKRWKSRLIDQTFKLVTDEFWTLPYDYSEMQKVCPSLYSKLSEADIIFFKGDLNYRKLVGDRDWPHSVPFDTALRGFHPAPLCSLRTLKAEVVVGLPEELDKEMAKNISDWLISGDYAVIQFSKLKIT